ncbi:hypothetical protein SDC9_148233 [bioreactor metagenome]|uniref:Uncharacterized protein n=1 Tax=bioreactor metagenome TaxID=1076179 RepID=A0A645EKF1_9ZZZZ
MSADCKTGSCSHFSRKIIVLVEYPGLSIGIISTTGQVPVSRCIHKTVIVVFKTDHHALFSYAPIGKMNGEGNRIISGEGINSSGRSFVSGGPISQIPAKGIDRVGGKLGSAGKSDHVVTGCRYSLGKRHLIIRQGGHTVEAIIIQFLRTACCHDKKKQQHSR